MGEEADWRGLEEEEGTLSPPAAEDDQREMWERHSELSEAMGEDAEAERGCPDGASPGPEQDKRLPEGDRLLGNEPGAGNEPGPEPAPDSQPEDGAQVCLKAGAAVTVVFSAKEEARSLQTLVGVVGKRSGRVSDTPDAKATVTLLPTMRTVGDIYKAAAVARFHAATGLDPAQSPKGVVKLVPTGTNELLAEMKPVKMDTPIKVSDDADPEGLTADLVFRFEHEQEKLVHERQQACYRTVEGFITWAGQELELRMTLNKFCALAEYVNVAKKNSILKNLGRAAGNTSKASKDCAVLRKLETFVSKYQGNVPALRALIDDCTLHAGGTEGATSGAATDQLAAPAPGKKRKRVDFFSTRPQRCAR